MSIFSGKKREILRIYIGSQKCMYFLILLGYKFAMLEIKSVISAVLRKCRLEPILGKEKVIAKFRMTVRATGGLWVKVRSRKS